MDRELVRDKIKLAMSQAMMIAPLFEQGLIDQNQFKESLEKALDLTVDELVQDNLIDDEDLTSFLAPSNN